MRLTKPYRSSFLTPNRSSRSGHQGPRCCLCTPTKYDRYTVAPARASSESSRQVGAVSCFTLGTRYNAPSFGSPGPNARGSSSPDSRTSGSVLVLPYCDLPAATPRAISPTWPGFQSRPSASRPSLRGKSASRAATYDWRSLSTMLGGSSSAVKGYWFSPYGGTIIASFGFGAA